MINLYLKLDNPWGKEDFNTICSTSGVISKNKAWEFETYRCPNTLAEFVFTFSFRGRDHAGLKLEIGLLGFNANLTVYDTRHWNYKKDCWENYDDVISTTQD